MSRNVLSKPAQRFITDARQAVIGVGLRHEFHGGFNVHCMSGINRFDAGKDAATKGIKQVLIGCVNALSFQQIRMATCENFPQVGREGFYSDYNSLPLIVFITDKRSFEARNGRAWFIPGKRPDFGRFNLRDKAAGLHYIPSLISMTR